MNCQSCNTNLGTVDTVGICQRCRELKVNSYIRMLFTDKIKRYIPSENDTAPLVDVTPELYFVE